MVNESIILHWSFSSTACISPKKMKKKSSGGCSQYVLHSTQLQCRWIIHLIISGACVPDGRINVYI